MSNVIHWMNIRNSDDLSRAFQENKVIQIGDEYFDSISQLLAAHQDRTYKYAHIYEALEVLMAIVIE